MKRGLLLLLLPLSNAAAAPAIVENGQPRAEIVISETPTRTQRVAAEEFRTQIEKISGARLPIVTRPGGSSVKVFIGASPGNPIPAEGLEFGAYRIASGEDWLALVGDDSDFVPVAPFAQGNSDIPRAQAEWEKIMGAPYGMPGAGTYKHRLRLPGTTGKPDGASTDPKETLEVWGLDERGSFNAVCGFLRKLGARWYLPGEVGEVLPQLATIPLEAIDETVNPDFRLRQFNFRFGTCGPETAMWAMRLGIRNDERIFLAHGMSTMTNREAVYALHPDWFAIYGGKTDYKPGDSKCQLCYSNEELFRESVRYARTLFDTYPLETVSIMPPDGYTAICQCEKCKGKDSPERHERGRLSNHVWDFVNRVAKEVAKTHPDRKILNCAYGVYTLPPDNVEKLEPNVQVCIVGGRRPINKGGAKGEGESAPEALRAGWAKKTDNPLLIFENYPFIDRGWYLPAFDAPAFCDTVAATRGISEGEDVWLSAGRDFATEGIAYNHFQVWFTARSYWSAVEPGADALLGEYCRRFFGPAEAGMRAFLDFCAAHWSEMEDEKAIADEALALFEKAKAKVDEGSVEGRRLALYDDFLEGLRMKSLQLGQKRGPVPAVRMVGEAREVVIDGSLEDTYWQNCPTAATGTLRELQTGRLPTFGTRFKTGWLGSDLYLAIECDERPGEVPNHTATGDDDPAIFYGDLIEIEIATETHSYYQIAISPDGHVVDLDRGTAKQGAFGWDSKAEVATRIEDGRWIAEVRLPITADENDPLNQIIGRKPTQSLPWHLNVCRQRIREDGQEHSALSPTGKAGFHEPLKFAHFYDGRSFKFEADPTVTDYVIASRAAGDLMRQRKTEDALGAFVALSESKDATDFQKSDALEQAVQCARNLRDAEKVDELIAKIPLEPVAKTLRMVAALDRREAEGAIADYSGEDFAIWPFWQRGAAGFARGRLFAAAGDGAKAEADLTAALEWVADPRIRLELQLAIAQNRERNLKDAAAALQAYRDMAGSTGQNGSSTYFYGVLGATRLLQESGKFDEALTMVRRVDATKLTGTWRGQFLLAEAGVLAASGQAEKARAAYRAIADDTKVEENHRKSALDAIPEPP